MNRFINPLDTEPVPNAVLQLLRQWRVTPGATLLRLLQQQRPGLSRATMMRMVRELDDQVVVRGAARRTAYAARRPLRGSTAPLPLYRIDIDGRASRVALLDPLYPAGCALRYEQALQWPLDPDMRDGWFAGLPYPLDDMRPQGFLGRHLARHYWQLLQVNQDPVTWHEDDVLFVLSQVGSDSSGNHILGDAAYQRHLDTVRAGYALVTDATVADDYARLATQAIAAGVAGSSAGGEFPKFTACRLRDDQKIHVIVKFSGNDDSAGVRRWSDLLVCEHLALDTIARHLDLAAAASRIELHGGRTFLEVDRFDRHGEFGRSALCSWAALEAALIGGMAGEPWNRAAARLLREKYINRATHDAIVLLFHFGRLIGNSDMHEGNLSFRPESVPATAPLALAPAYDMLPMMYAPVRGIELPQPVFAPDFALPDERVLWLKAAGAALHFWQSAAGDERISGDFRTICAANRDELERLVARAP